MDIRQKSTLPTYLKPDFMTLVRYSSYTGRAKKNMIINWMTLIAISCFGIITSPNKAEAGFFEWFTTEYYQFQICNHGPYVRKTNVSLYNRYSKKSTQLNPESVPT